MTALLGGGWRDFSHSSGAQRQQPPETHDGFECGGEDNAGHEFGARCGTPKAVRAPLTGISQGGGAGGPGTVLRCLGADRFGLLDVDRLQLRGERRALNPKTRAGLDAAGSGRQMTDPAGCGPQPKARLTSSSSISVCPG
ncbi:hypothetical protein [Paraburkholderia guartelaensis]|uniref:hypothetical protein n=1 Tax=Paraburkholderia guartelaensis TaxID=2546446 RepID=UPI00140BE26D|nr:hypothetical protein [Paraburkholderia guartelaensis]